MAKTVSETIEDTKRSYRHEIYHAVEFGDTEETIRLLENFNKAIMRRSLDPFDSDFYFQETIQNGYHVSELVLLAIRDGGINTVDMLEVLNERGHVFGMAAINAIKNHFNFVRSGKAEQQARLTGRYTEDVIKDSLAHLNKIIDFLGENVPRSLAGADIVAKECGYDPLAKKIQTLYEKNVPFRHHADAPHPQAV